ncbi:MAG: hypothetical protein ACOYOU_12075 [Kiritimatiellia bacterium]
MRLQQNQVWQSGDQFFRIVRLERKAVQYKVTKDSAIVAGPHFYATKKDFCRLLKGAALLPPTPRIGPVAPASEQPAATPATATPPATW